MLNPKSASIEDASVQTEVISVLDEELKKIQRTLTNEIKLRECLMHLLKKYKMENCMLRKEIQKLSKLDDHILIDQETFSEVKTTFQKFKRFISVMKEYGLFECIALLGWNENTDVVLRPLILNASKKCMQLVESEGDGEEEGEGWMPPDLSQNGTTTNNSHKVEYERKELVKDKALVQRVYREVRENYGRPSFPPKHGRRPEAPLRKRPSGRMEAVSKIRQLRSPKEFFCEPLCDHHLDRPKLKGVLGVKRSKPDPSSSHGFGGGTGFGGGGTGSVKTGSEAKSYMESASGTGFGGGTGSAKTGSEAKNYVESASGSGTGSARGTGFGGGGTGSEVKSYLESGSDAASTDKDVKSLAESEVYSVTPKGCPSVATSKGSSKGSQNPSVKGSQNPSVVSSAKGQSVATKGNNPSAVSSKGQNPSSSAKGSQNNPSVVSSSKGQNLSNATTTKGSQNLSTTTKGFQNPSAASSKGSQNSMGSHQYSSVASSTATGSHQYSSVASTGSQNHPSAASSKGSQNPKGSQYSSVAQNSNAVVPPSTKGLPNPPGAKGGSELDNETSRPSSKKRRAKKSSSSDSVPSLSDITTVSSRSLNTDSVLGQISNEEA